MHCLKAFLNETSDVFTDISNLSKIICKNDMQFIVMILIRESGSQGFINI